MNLNDADIDPVKVEEYTAVLENSIDLDSIAGTYCGILPSNVETTLTLTHIAAICHVTD